MFTDPFSFNGRIGRLEYFSSLVIATLAVTFISILAALYWNWLVLLFIPVFYFLLAQGTKRCHDLDNNMLWQFIPVYVFWLLLAPGSAEPNKYGMCAEELLGTGSLR
ncbi:Uncharacterized membrane protein YhaH, DUF805 family [Chitinophaga sp. YR627]|uniref:DUF805 domain-containing protein n=1 Tax=Chitinophaga sp. YR627 TaxID=1881041 RepID=UPI0008F199C5|nr:DUF805 domain-containing protein [Chitinophaga sp. YR627]SFO90182.1 Uncharacterized membrane protein YhaH, DUF805 family [Chitinophaga sp. YR627]